MAPVILYLVLLTVFAGEACSFEWKDPAVAENEVARYRVLQNGRETLEQKEINIEVKEHEYLVTFSVVDEEGRSEFSTVFSRGTDFRALRYYRETSTQSGKRIVSEETRLTNNPNYPKQVCPLFGNYFALRCLPRISQRRDLSYSCLYPGGSSFVLRIKIDSSEKVETPLGAFSCIKIRESLDMKSLKKGLFGSILNIIPLPIVPRTTYWFQKDPPHFLVRREGIAGPPPRNFMIVEELVHYEKRAVP